ncbi:hypothetical protein BYT27DRAFT_7259493 [Phlegmacium glaucopus]|nr:hypothetical protein BYT27DRAFT_7259493 [Phlegmacium glaucopus]
MSQHEACNLVFFLEGDPLARPHDIFDIPIGASVFRLKAAIQQRVEILHDIDPDRLELWKLNVMVPIDPDHTLAQRLVDLGNIATCSKLLSSGKKVGVLFPEPHSGEHLHIVVQILDPPSLNAASRPISWYSFELIERMNEPLYDCLRPEASEPFKVVTAMPDNLDLSNPSTFSNLPWPSLLSMPYQHFESKEINGIDYFEYLGRSQFHKLQNHIKNKTFLKGSESLYLYGTSGSGKSHLIATLVYHLIHEGKRVFYIPDCSSLFLEPAGTMWGAYHFAFYDLPVLRTLGDPLNVDALIRLVANDQNVYIIVDQVNTLEVAGDDSRKERKDQALCWLDALRKQSGILVLWIFGGMSSDETNQWFIRHGHHIPHLSPDQRQCVEHLTGSIPLLLRCLFNITNFVELEFRNMPDLRNLSLEVSTFGRTKLASLDSLSKHMYLQIMRACVRGDYVSCNDRTLYDLRHFYVDETDIGRCTCGIAFETMMSLLRTYDDAPFLDDLWYTAVSRSNNPIVRGFLAEQICLSYIATNGLKTVHPMLGEMRTGSFETQPAFREFLLTDLTIQLYIPTAYNFLAVDGIILLLDRKSKQANIFSIQFTLSQNHKQ